MPRAEIRPVIPGPLQVRRLAACLLSAAVVACTHKPVEPPPAPTTTRITREWSSPAVRAVVATLPAESEPADMLTSTEALAAGLAYTPELALQRAQVDIARAEVQRARQRRNPIMTLTPEHLLQGAAGISPWVIALQLVWPVRTAGKRNLEIEQALAMNDAALLTSADAIWKLRASIRGAVCALELANATNTLVSEESALRADLALRLRKQADAGIASRYDAARTQLERDLAVQRAHQAEGALHAARHDLALLAGLPVAEIGKRTIGATCLEHMTVAAVSPEDLQERAIGTRLDLRARLAEFRAADATLRAETAKRFPDVDLGPGYTYDQGDRRILFTISGELPIYSHNNAAIARAQADRSRAIAEVDKLQWSVRMDVDRALDQVQLGQLQYAEAVKIVEESQELLNRDETRFKSGEVDQPAVIATRIADLTARIDALTAERSLLDAVAALEAASQSTLVPPFFDTAAATQLLSPDALSGTH